MQHWVRLLSVSDYFRSSLPMDQSLCWPQKPHQFHFVPFLGCLRLYTRLRHHHVHIVPCPQHCQYLKFLMVVIVFHSKQSRISIHPFLGYSTRNFHPLPYCCYELLFRWKLNPLKISSFTYFAKWRKPTHVLLERLITHFHSEFIANLFKASNMIS